MPHVRYNGKKTYKSKNMDKIAIFYGSTTGTTAAVAKKAGKLLGVEDRYIYNVAEVAPSAVGNYDVLILGTSTWGNGELQEDWEDFIAGLEVQDLSDKTIAIFGCGDETMSETFCGAVGTLYQRLLPTGATFIGSYDTEGYHYKETPAKVNGLVRGLLLDEVNHPELTDLRLRAWTTLVKDTLANNKL